MIVIAASDDEEDSFQAHPPLNFNINCAAEVQQLAETDQAIKACHAAWCSQSLLDEEDDEENLTIYHVDVPVSDVHQSCNL